MPEIRVLSVDEESPQAELMRLKEAFARFSSGSIPSNVSEAALVWAVLVEGRWQDAFPRPTGAPTPVESGHFFVIIDADTGEIYLAGTFE
jgi:hypothetical protein